MPHHRAILAPTTQAQVSGHRFLRRRMHHGLVLGDARMIHDPLAKRQRAAVFGTALTVLLMMGSGLLAALDPHPHPGAEAPLLRAGSGALYVRLGQEVHPVSNLASARLIVGEPVNPADIDDEALAALTHGRPVGLSDAPGLIAAEAPPEEKRTWSACVRDGKMSVELGRPAPVLEEDTALLVRDSSRAIPLEYLVTAAGRAELPPASTPAGVVVRRRLGVNASTPVWEAPEPLLTAMAEHEAIAFPQPLPEVWRTEEAAWLSRPEGVHEITEKQATMLIDMGASSRMVSPAQVAARPEAPHDLRLPERSMRFLNPAQTDLCVTGPGGGIGYAESDASGVTLPRPSWNRGGERGEIESRVAVAERFVAETRGAIAVDTGAGYHVVSPHGVRHRLPDEKAVEVLGLPEPIPGWWPVISLLPEGTPLSEEEALR